MAPGQEDPAEEGGDEEDGGLAREGPAPSDGIGEEAADGAAEASACCGGEVEAGLPGGDVSDGDEVYGAWLDDGVFAMVGMGPCRCAHV